MAQNRRNLPSRLRNAVLKMVEDGNDDISLREVARTVGVSATATYRHFTSKDDLIASVMADGFRDLSGQLAAIEPSHRRDLYLLFASQNPGLFRLMWSPLLRHQKRFPVLKDEVSAFCARYQADIGAATHGQAALGAVGIEARF